MSDELTGYELSRQWFDFCFENPDLIRPIHTAIYTFAIEHWNRLGKREKFGFPSQMTMEAIGVKSYSTYIPALNDIVDWGFITMIEKSKNQYSSNIIALSKINKAPVKALDKAFVKHSSKHPQSNCDSTYDGNRSIDKQINQEQENKEQGNNNSRDSAGETEGFDEFWDAYEKKVDKKKSQQKWKKLSKADKESIMEFIPTYKAYQPDARYRKNPTTFFNNRSWEDEFIKTEVAAGRNANSQINGKSSTGTVRATKGDRRAEQLKRFRQ